MRLKMVNNSDGKNKLKILFVSHEFLIGGSTMSLISLIQGLQKCSDIEIQVLIPQKKEGLAKKEFSKRKINYKTMLYRRNFKRISEKYGLKLCIFDILNNIATFKLCKYIKKEKIDIVCSNSTGVDVGARAALLAKVPHIYYVREFMEEDHGCEFRNKKRMRNLLEASEYVIFISKAIQEKYTQLYRLNKYTMFFDGFILDDYIIPNHAILQSDKLNIIQIGALSDGKGAMNSLRTIKHLRDIGINNIHLEFVGNGIPEYEDAMKQYIQNNRLEQFAVISGYSDNVKDRIALNDVLLMNSRAEGFGRVTIEGMLGGLLVIGRNSAGTAEIIKNGQNGLLFDNDEELLNILMNVCKNKESYSSIAQNGHQWAVVNFSYKDVGMKFKNFIGL